MVATLTASAELLGRYRLVNPDLDPAARDYLLRALVIAYMLAFGPLRPGDDLRAVCSLEALRSEFNSGDAADVRRWASPALFRGRPILRRGATGP